MRARLSIDDIFPNPDQPRKLFDVAKLQELAASIEASGLLQPITVRKVKAGHEIVAGERRWRAHKLLVEQGKKKFAKVDCEVVRMSEERRDINAIIENLQRVDVTPLEEARGYARMLEAGMPLDELAQKVGKAPWRIEERTRLLNLEPGILKLYETGNLRQEAASEISRVKDHGAQERIVKMVGPGQLNGYNAVRAAVDSALGLNQATELFGEAPKANEQEVKMVSNMEHRVDKIAGMVSAGWREGECVIAAKVSPDRARLMADKLKAMQRAISIMETQLRSVSAQAEFAMQASA